MSFKSIVGQLCRYDNWSEKELKDCNKNLKLFVINEKTGRVYLPMKFTVEFKEYIQEVLGLLVQDIENKRKDLEGVKEELIHTIDFNENDPDDEIYFDIDKLQDLYEDLVYLLK